MKSQLASSAYLRAGAPEWMDSYRRVVAKAAFIFATTPEFNTAPEDSDNAEVDGGWDSEYMDDPRLLEGRLVPLLERLITDTRNLDHHLTWPWPHEVEAVTEAECLLEDCLYDDHPISFDALYTALRAAYRAAAMIHHPDRIDVTDWQDRVAHDAPRALPELPGGWIAEDCFRCQRTYPTPYVEPEYDADGYISGLHHQIFCDECLTLGGGR